MIWYDRVSRICKQGRNLQGWLKSEAPTAMPVHLQHGFLIAYFSNTILAGASVGWGVAWTFWFSLCFPDAILACGDARVAVGAWSDGHQQQRGSGYIWSGASRASDASGLVHLLGTGVHQVSPFVISLLGSAALGHKYQKVGSVGYVFFDRLTDYISLQ